MHVVNARRALSERDVQRKQYSHKRNKAKRKTERTNIKHTFCFFSFRSRRSSSLLLHTHTHTPTQKRKSGYTALSLSSGLPPPLAALAGEATIYNTTPSYISFFSCFYLCSKRQNQNWTPALIALLVSTCVAVHQAYGQGNHFFYVVARLMRRSRANTFFVWARLTMKRVTAQIRILHMPGSGRHSSCGL